MTITSYWEVFYRPDIPLLERALWIAAAPLAIPASMLGAVSGCGSPDDRLPFPEDHATPLPFPKTDNDAATDAGGKDTPPEDAGPEDVYTCVPDPCETGRLDLSRRNGDQAMCISFATPKIIAEGPHVGLSVADIDSDGDTDIYLFNAGAPNLLLQNQSGGAAFTNVAQDFALDLSGHHHFALWGDLYPGGGVDLLLAGEDGASLYFNGGDAFTLTTQLTTTPAHAAYWFVQGYLLGTENGLRFYAPNADGTYEDVAALMGLIDNGDARRFVVADFDNDQASDIYVANETGSNRMFRNKGDGTFESVEDLWHVDMPRVESSFDIQGQSPSRDAAWVQLSVGQKPMLHVSNYGAASWLFEAQNDGTYANVAKDYGLQDGGNTIRAAWADFLNEGAPSVFVARSDQLNLLYVPEFNSFGQVTGFRDFAWPNAMSGPSIMVGAAWADFNSDGQLDLVTAAYNGAVKVYLNESKWAKVCPSF